MKVSSEDAARPITMSALGLSFSARKRAVMTPGGVAHPFHFHVRDGFLDGLLERPQLLILERSVDRELGLLGMRGLWRTATDHGGGERDSGKTGGEHVGSLPSTVSFRRQCSPCSLYASQGSE